MSYLTPIKTANSELRLFDLKPEWQVKMREIAAYVNPLLDYHPEIIVFGNVCHQQRSIGFFSDTSEGYQYSGKLAASKPMTNDLRELIEYVNQLFSAEFNGILVNKYENGEEYISQHADDEKGLNPGVGVVAISVGAVRKFRICNRATKKTVIDIPTEPNKIIQMYGDFQKEFTHGVPVEKKVKDVRYSFTFRKHLS